MHQYGGQDNVTREIQATFFEGKSILDMLSLMFKRKIVDFLTKPAHCGLSTEVLQIEVSILVFIPSILPYCTFWLDQSFFSGLE